MEWIILIRPSMEHIQQMCVLGELIFNAHILLLKYKELKLCKSFTKSQYKTQSSFSFPMFINNQEQDPLTIYTHGKKKKK